MTFSKQLGTICFGLLYRGAGKHLAVFVFTRVSLGFVCFTCAVKAAPDGRYKRFPFLVKVKKVNKPYWQSHTWVCNYSFPHVIHPPKRGELQSQPHYQTIWWFNSQTNPLVRVSQRGTRSNSQTLVRLDHGLEPTTSQYKDKN